MAAAPSGLLRRVSMGYCIGTLLPQRVGAPFPHLNYSFSWLGSPGRPVARPTMDWFSKNSGDRTPVEGIIRKMEAKSSLVGRSDLFCSPPFRDVSNYRSRRSCSSRNQVSVSQQACQLFSKSSAKKSESKATSSQLFRKKTATCFASMESIAAVSQLSRREGPISIVSSESNAISTQQSSQQNRKKSTRGSPKSAFQISKARQSNSRHVQQIPKGRCQGSETNSDRPFSVKRKVVLVESPVKAKTIQRYLGDDYTVLASNGHVRDLAERSGSVRPNDDFALVWEVTPDARCQLDKIKAALENAKYLVLACDPDREGEAIAWHVFELMSAEGFLKQRHIKVQRVAFNEITDSAIRQAMESPRDISMTLVNAYLARRALDYLIGFGLSPVLWKKLPGSRSAGRVQSAALALVCEREKLIEEFVAQEYWTVKADVCRAVDLQDGCDTGFEMSSLKESVQRLPVFCVRPNIVDGKKLESLSLTSEAQAQAVAGSLLSAIFTVSSVKKGLIRRNPPKPFITSTLQQQAQNKLGFSAARTMHLAQQIYEGVNLGNNEAIGLITYMRTDSYKMSEEAVRSIRTFAAQRYGDEYVPIKAQKFETKVKNAQEAHEAIRPTDIYRLPSTLMGTLEKDALRLYSLIWSHSVACQMEQAVYNQTTVICTDETGMLTLHGSSSIVSFSGFMAALQDMEGHPFKQDAIFEGDFDKNEETEGDQKLPHLQAGDLIKLVKVKPEQHFTAGPPRFTEGSLIRKLEELGIGRPSTYASVLKVLQSRRYVTVENRSIRPEHRGCMVSAFLWHFFPKSMDYEFTANLEEQLDKVSAGLMDWRDLLRNFWSEFHPNVISVMKIPFSKIVELLEEIFAKQFFKGVGESRRTCPSCGIGKMTLKLTRYGAGYFFGCDTYPQCRYTTNVLCSEDTESMQRDEEEAQSNLRVISNRNLKTLGIDPVSQKQILLKTGPFGIYIQLGPDGKGRKCFRIPAVIKPLEMTLEEALEFMRYPLVLGKHPDDGEIILLGIGNRGFFIKHRAAIAPLPKRVHHDNVTLKMALELLSGDTVRHRGRRRLRSTVKDGVLQSKVRKQEKDNKMLSGEVCLKKANSKNSSDVCHQKNSKGIAQSGRAGANNILLSKKGKNKNTGRMPKRTPLKEQGLSANGCPESGRETTIENSTLEQEILQAVA